jgi:phosphate transport system substrate-binding protein
MAHMIKRVSVLFLLALLTSTTVLFAQDTTSTTIVGSGIVNSIVESLAEANETDTFTITTTGTTAGFEQFCAGEVDVVTATRAISADEDANCISNNINYGEFLVAHSIITVAVNPNITFLDCLTENDFNTLFSPTAVAETTNWTVYDESIEDLPITFILPQDNTVEYVILDSMVAGDGLRDDAITYDDVETAISQIAEDDGAIAVLPYSSDLAENDSIRLLDVSYGTTTGCASPSVENVENRLYTATMPMFLYVNRASLENEDLQNFMDFVTSTESSAVVEANGFAAPTDDTYQLNADILVNEDADRQFSGTESQFTVPDNLIGQIDIGGSANAYSLLNTNATQMTSNNPQLTINIKFDGQEAGIRRMCNGESDITVLSSALADDALAGCEANNINTVPINLGTQATVLVANEADTDFSCLTADQIETIWAAPSTDTVMKWSDVDETFPEQDMTLFGLSTSNTFSDILLSAEEGAIEPVRRDTELSNDALYRAAAVGNVEGSLTYMSWQDYRRVLSNNQSDIQLVSVDDGAGCVTPSVDTIVDGTYPLSRSASLLVNELSLTDISVQSFIWRLFSDQSWTSLDSNGFVGIDFGDLPAFRAELEVQFSLAETNVAANVGTPDAESTEEPNIESTEEPDATDESSSNESDANSDTDSTNDAESTEEASD